MLFRTSLLALALSLTSLSPITSAYGSNLAVDDELREAVKKVKSKCEIRLPNPTEDDWNQIKTNLNFSAPKNLRFLYEQLNSCFTQGVELAHVHRGTDSEFIKYNKRARSQGLPSEWIAFCFDNGSYHCFNNDSGQIKTWDPHEFDDKFVDTFSNLSEWIKVYFKFAFKD